MSEDINEEKLEDTKDTEITPLEVKVINQPEVKKISSDFDSVDDSQYESMYPTEELIKEYTEEEEDA